MKIPRKIVKIRPIQLKIPRESIWNNSDPINNAFIDILDQKNDGLDPNLASYVHYFRLLNDENEDFPL